MNAQLDTLQLHVAPVSSGSTASWLQMRGWQGREDLPAIADVFRRSMAADRIDRIAPRASWDHELRPTRHYDPALDLQLVMARGEVVGYVQTRVCREAAGTVVFRHAGVLVPEWRRRGLGAAMLAQAHRRLRSVAQDVRAGRSAFLQASASETQSGLIVLLLRHGYAAVRHTYSMLRPDLEGVPAVGLPAGIEVRRASAEHYRAIWQAHEEAARDRWGHVTCRENGYEEWLQNPANQPDLWQVAWDGDQVAGLAMASISAEENASLRRQRGRVDSLVVRRAWRRRGLGRALVARSLARLRDSGMAEAASEVDVEDAYGAMRLFSGLGYRPVRRTAIYRRPLHGQ